MSPELHLFLHNVIVIVNAIASVLFIIFVIWNNPRRRTNWILAIGMVFTVIFYVSHGFGVNTPDPDLSRRILMANLSIIFVTLLVVHTIISVIGKEKERKNVLIGMYALCIGLTAFFLLFPETFLAESAPKMYFPNYYVPGSLHWVMRLLANNLMPAYLLFEMLWAYAHAPDNAFKNRLKYLMGASAIAYVTGYIPVLLIYDIPVDPAWGLPFAIIFYIPFMYGVVKYELLDIRIIAKNAFYYGVIIASIGSIIVLLNVANDWLVSSIGGFPYWAIPFVTSAVMVLVSFLVWRKLRESDVLKYEFITTATHKMRTPLTHIKWATENLNKLLNSEEAKAQLKYIESANGKLVELTNILMNVSDTDSNEYEYKRNAIDLSTLVGEVLSSLMYQITAKEMSVAENIEKDLRVICDTERIRFIIQTFIENAVHYTPQGGKITVSAVRNGKHATFSVTDSGIGLDKEDMKFLFTKFYRGKHARLADTEGMGIGLYISKDIIRRHHGKIWAESSGLDKGSTFSFYLPLVKQK